MNLLTAASPVLLVIVGLVVCLFGYRLLRFTLGLAGFAVGAALGLTLAGLIPNASQVFTIVVAVVLGIVTAVVATLLYKVGVFLFGAGAGVLAASIVVSAAGWHYPILIRLLSGIAGGVLTLVLERPLVSVLSALAGSWGVVFGAFRLLGWWHVTSGAPFAQSRLGLAVACWLLLGLIGAGVQLRAGGKHRKERG